MQTLGKSAARKIFLMPDQVTEYLGKLLHSMDPDGMGFGLMSF